MIYIPKFFFFLINYNLDRVLTALDLENVVYRIIDYEESSRYNAFYRNTNKIILDKSVNTRVLEALDISKIILQGIWEKIYDGVSLTDIESFLFFILFVRFVFFIIRYNLKTSFYITCITLFAAYCWYRHLIDIVVIYRYALAELPFFSRFGEDSDKFAQLRAGVVLSDLSLRDEVHWYNPGQLLYIAFTKAVVSVDPDTGDTNYIDPISVFISGLSESKQRFILPYYYKVYNFFIPKIFSIVTRFWQQISGLAAYVLITRVGKKYCPYLIRWHWTVLILITIIEPVFVELIFRANSFGKNLSAIHSQTQTFSAYDADQQLSNLGINLLDTIIIWLIVGHLSFLIFALFHAICGQYFYIPILVENAELHIGPRPKDSVYSGGYTSWQDPDEKQKNAKRFFPKIWYGWLGKGSNNEFKLKNKFEKILKKIRRLIKRIKN